MKKAVVSRTEMWMAQPPTGTPPIRGFVQVGGALGRQLLSHRVRPSPMCPVGHADKREPRPSEWRCDTSQRSYSSAVKQPPFFRGTRCDLVRSPANRVLSYSDWQGTAIHHVGKQGKAAMMVRRDLTSTARVEVGWDFVNLGLKPTLQMTIRQGRLHGKLLWAIDENRPGPGLPPHFSLESGVARSGSG